jgi:hypothetical protein
MIDRLLTNLRDDLAGIAARTTGTDREHVQAAVASVDAGAFPVSAAVLHGRTDKLAALLSRTEVYSLAASAGSALLPLDPESLTNRAAACGS